MAPASSANNSSWKDCYTAALFQDDATKVPVLIARAESEIVARGRTLFEAPGENGAEIRALDNALRMLDILKKCVKSPPQADGGYAGRHPAQPPSNASSAAAIRA